MLKIDGSYGEGGGQILRTALGLSVLTNTSIGIYNIRKNRPSPGLKPQHYTTIKTIQQICNAEVSGLSVGSKQLVFKPNEVKQGTYIFDIGTAGSITLAFQAVILSILNSKKTIKIKLVGGSDVKWSPSWDFFENVFLELLNKMCIKIEASLKKRGYYPKGGAEAEIKINPVKKIHPLKLTNQEINTVQGLINISDLPDHINKRMKHTVVQTLLKENIKADIFTQRCETYSPGVGITLWIKNKNNVLGSCVIGKRGVSSENVGRTAAEKIINEVKHDATIDLYSFDQIVPYFFLAAKNGTSKCNISKVSKHAETNMWLLKKFLDVEFDLIHTDKGCEVQVYT